MPSTSGAGCSTTMQMYESFFWGL